jgi:hypothetical protein
MHRMALPVDCKQIVIVEKERAKSLSAGMTSRGRADKCRPRSFHDDSQRLSDSIWSMMERHERSRRGSYTPACWVRYEYWSMSEPATTLWKRLQERARDEMSRAHRYRAISSTSSGERESRDMCRWRSLHSIPRPTTHRATATADRNYSNNNCCRRHACSFITGEDTSIHSIN